MTAKAHDGTLWDTGSVLYFDIGGGDTDVSICEDSSNWTLKMGIEYALGLNETKK